jgi:hypothetical protein
MRPVGGCMRILTATVACVVLAGCGSGGSGATQRTTGEKTIPKARFIARADRLCADAYAKTKRLKTPPLPPRTIEDLDDVAAFFRAQVAIGSRELARIRDLGVAVPGAAAQARNLETADRMVNEMGKTAFHAHQTHLVRTRRHYGRVQEFSRHATRLAKRFGYRVCGQGGVHRVVNR